jgi:two-component system sensor kinase FixL
MGKNSTNQHKSEELAILSGAVESTNEGFVTIDDNHRVIFFNRAAERIFGYNRREVLGRDLSVLLAPQCSPDHRKAVERYLQSKRPRVLGHARDLVATRKNGATFPCSISFSAARVGGHTVFTGIVRDLTETRKLQDQVARAERLAELGRMVAEISHEIKNPLTIIGGFVRRLIRSSQEEKTLSKLNIIEKEVQRLEHLLAELKDLYSPVRFRMRTFDLNEMLKEVHALAKQACRGTIIRVSLKSAEIPLPVRGNREKLKQVLLNVLKNAVEAMQGEGSLTMRSFLKDGRVVISMEDRGPGIPEHIRERVFDPFFTTKKGGSGLGLSICKRIVEDHRNGSFTLMNRKGGGAVVQLSLPLSGQRKKKKNPGR